MKSLHTAADSAVILAKQRVDQATNRVMGSPGENHGKYLAGKPLTGAQG